MNWATAIPLVTLLAVVFGAGVAWSKLEAVELTIKQVREDMKESAKAQGGRIGDVEDRVKVLEDFRARTEAVREHDMSGRVRNS